MRRDITWGIFLLIVAGLALWFIIAAARAVTTYTYQSEYVEAHVETWSIKEKKGDRYQVLANYAYDWKGKTYKNAGQVGPCYPNPWAARAAQERFKGEGLSVWLDPRLPEFGVLQKLFPYKKTFSALALIGLTLYFFLLCLYLRGKNARPL